jgi:hypothetical protein
VQKLSGDRWIFGFLVTAVAWALFGLPFIYLNWQWLMHDAAGFFTFVLVVVGVLQLGLFAWQLTLIRKSLTDTRIAADAAKDAANAANIQAHIAERTLSEVERPWLFIEGATISRREMPGEQPLIPNHWYISFRCKNVGRMPAVTEECIIKLVDKDEIASTPDYSGPFAFQVPRWVSQGDAFDTRKMGPAPPGMKDGKPIMFIVYGRLTYRELNGKPHHTGFAVEVSPHMAAFSGHPNDAYDYYD